MNKKLNNYTDKQLEILEISRNDAKIRLVFLNNVIPKIESATVKLPHINEKGNSVRHYCNLDMWNILEDYKKERNNIKFLWNLE